MPNAPAPRQLGTAGILVALGDQPAGLATHVPALPAAQISSGVRGATLGLADICLRQDLARPSPIQLSFQTFVLSCPATRVLWRFPDTPSSTSGSTPAGLSRVGPWGGGLLTRLRTGPSSAWWPWTRLTLPLCCLKSQPGDLACVFSELASIGSSPVPMVSPVAGPSLGPPPCLGVGSPDGRPTCCWNGPQACVRLR